MNRLSRWRAATAAVCGLVLTGCPAPFESNPFVCREGFCNFELIAACSTDGYLVGIESPSLELGPEVPIGFRPQTLARMRDVLLVADVDQRLRQVRISDFATLPGETPTGKSPNDILASENHALLVNSLDNTLQVLAPTVDGPGTEGLGLKTIAQLNFGENSSPNAMARIGDALYVTLGGGFTGPEAAAAGQKVAKVDISDVRNPVLVEHIDLSGLDLKPPPGYRTVARPSDIAYRKGKLYVALSNLGEQFGDPSGPPMLAVIDPATNAVSTLELDPAVCSNVITLTSEGDRLFVTCFGDPVYAPPDYDIVSVEKSGVVLVDAEDRVAAVYNVACPAGASGCKPPVAGKSTWVDDLLFLGDQNGGQVFVLETRGDSLVEKRGYGVPAGPLNVCPPKSKPFSNVLDLVALPARE